MKATVKYLIHKVNQSNKPPIKISSYQATKQPIMAPTLKSTVNKLEKSLIIAQRVLAKARALMVESDAAKADAKAAKAAAKEDKKRKAAAATAAPEKKRKPSKKDGPNWRQDYKAADLDGYTKMCAAEAWRNTKSRRNKQLIRLVEMGYTKMEAAGALEAANWKIRTAVNILASTPMPSGTRMEECDVPPEYESELYALD